LRLIVVEPVRDDGIGSSGPDNDTHERDPGDQRPPSVWTWVGLTTLNNGGEGVVGDVCGRGGVGECGRETGVEVSAHW
jgi:hypothetical protein